MLISPLMNYLFFVHVPTWILALYIIMATNNKHIDAIEFYEVERMKTKKA